VRESAAVAFSMISEAPGRDDPLPASVIAQAEAACAGNAEEDRSAEQRRPSVARQVYSRFREEQQENTANLQKNSTYAITQTRSLQLLISLLLAQPTDPHDSAIRIH